MEVVVVVVVIQRETWPTRLRPVRLSKKRNLSTGY